jgi:hypothetical protein
MHTRNDHRLHAGILSGFHAFGRIFKNYAIFRRYSQFSSAFEISLGIGLAFYYMIGTYNTTKIMPYVEAIEHKVDVKSDGCRADGHLDVLAVCLFQELVQPFDKLQVGPELPLVLFLFGITHAVFLSFGKTAGEDAFQQFIILTITFFFGALEGNIGAQIGEDAVPGLYMITHIIDHRSIQVE